MMRYFAAFEGQRLEEARLRAIEAKELFDRTLPSFDFALDAGAAAYADGGDQHLTAAQRAASSA